MTERLTDDERDLLPWYLNGSLSASEQAAVEAWLARAPEGEKLLEAWRQVSAAAAGQAERAPAPEARSRLLERIRAESTSRPVRRSRLPLIAGGILAAVLCLLALWLTVRPGLTLHWSVEADAYGSFRVYRASPGSTAFELIAEVPAAPGQRAYSYADRLILPGQELVYWIEAVDPVGRPAGSRMVAASARQLIPIQAAIAFASVAFALAAMSLSSHLLSARAILRPAGLLR